MDSAYPTIRPCQERHFASFDATSLFYRHWPVAGASAGKKAIVLFHRGHEHGGRMAHLADELALPDYDFFAWDARGLGKSPGKRGYADNYGVLVKDVDAFVRHIATAHGIATENVVVIGQSFGAVTLATWVHDYAPRLRGMVLAAPAFKINLIVPGALAGLKLLYAARGNYFVKSYVKPTQLTRDTARIASYQADPLITRPIAANILLEVDEAATRVVADAAAIHVPTQILVSGNDAVVYEAPQQEFFDNLGTEMKELHRLDDFLHDTLGERNRAIPIGLARAFIKRLFAAAPAQPGLLDADQRGLTKTEFDTLSQPAATTAARLYWAMSRFWIGVGGRFSTGIKNGIATGFDSGSTLDYVYQNRKQGFTPIGKLVDNVFLNSIGWRGIRIRKHHLEQLIGQAIDLLKAAGQPVRILDIAAGHGRYILEAMAARPGQADSVLLRDYSPTNVATGRRLIAEKGLTGSVHFEQGDAFDQAGLAALQPRPTLAVVSGLYELFGDNNLVIKSLTGVAEALEAGSYLLYTNQPWHPQLEMIARSLTSHREGAAWVMRRRVQAEIDELVAHAGFEKIDQLTDQWGIFTVSLARRK